MGQEKKKVGRRSQIIALKNLFKNRGFFIKKRTERRRKKKSANFMSKYSFNAKIIKMHLKKRRRAGILL